MNLVFLLLGKYNPLRLVLFLFMGMRRSLGKFGIMDGGLIVKTYWVNYFDLVKMGLALLLCSKGAVFKNEVVLRRSGEVILFLVNLFAFLKFQLGFVQVHKEWENI